MTIEDKIKASLIERGILERPALEIISTAKEHKSLEGMVGRWGDSTADYPLHFMNVVWVSVKSITLEWIDTNMPLAFFRSMFTDN